MGAPLTERFAVGQLSADYDECVRRSASCRRTVAVLALLAVGVLGGCDPGPPGAARLRTMTDEQVAAELAGDPESAEAQYVTFMTDEGGLNPPSGVTERNLLIFAYEECAGLAPPPPPEWRRERLGQPVGFENFVHTARGFAHRLICPSE